MNRRLRKRLLKRRLLSSVFLVLFFFLLGHDHLDKILISVELNHVFQEIRVSFHVLRQRFVNFTSLRARFFLESFMLSLRFVPLV